MTRRIKLALLLIVLSVHVGSAQGIPAADVKITYIQAAVDDKGFTSPGRGVCIHLTTMPKTRSW